jgi:hypothetical protein
MRRDDLEEGLLGGLDRDLLAVYADELQRLGDPRGELITIDLYADDSGPSAELTERKRTIVNGLLGSGIADHPSVVFRYGFIDLVEPPADQQEAAGASPPAVDGVLDGPLGRYVRHVALVGNTERVRDLMVVLARHVRPFLTQLAIHGQSWLNRVDLPAELVARVVAAVPQLHTLEVSGRRVLPMIPFPTVRHLVASGYDALAALRPQATGPACFPLAGSLDLGVGWPPGTGELEGLLPPPQLPELTRLDLVRCDGQMGPDPSHDVFRFLRTLAIAPQLAWLRVPAVRTDEQATNLQAAIDRMPGLAELVVTDRYAPPKLLHHDRAEIQLPLSE